MALCVRELNLKAHKKTIVSSLNCAFEIGNVYCLLGENGAGKSTLLKYLCGYFPSQKNVFIDETPLETLLTTGALQNQLVYLPQDLVRADNFTCEEFVLSAFLKSNFQPESKNSPEVLEKLSAHLEEWSLSFIKNKRLPFLSGGEWKRTQLAYAFAKNSKFILLDEPDSHLDWKHISILQQKIIATAKLKKTIILATHNWEFAAKTATHFGVLVNQSLQWYQRNKWDELLSTLDNAFGTALSINNR